VRNVSPFGSDRDLKLAVNHLSFTCDKGAAAKESVMFADFFDAFLRRLLYALGTAFGLFLFYGFWRGFSFARTSIALLRSTVTDAESRRPAAQVRR
jgi:hypothetical protein